MATLGTILSIILALLRVAPATLAAAQARSQRDREATATRRLQEKDARVDVAIKAELDHQASDEPKQP